MREIKFRAWDKRYKRMINDIHETFEDSSFGDFLHDSNFIPMQYTGLKDKNGVEVYEGDIVRTEYMFERADGSLEPSNVENVIEFKYGRFTDPYEDNIYFAQAGGVIKVTIIGNKYENPELLEENK